MLYKDIPVFIDSRADLYSPEFNGQNKVIFSDYFNIVNIGGYYEDQFNKYDFTHILTKTDSKLEYFLSRDKNYKQIYSDDYFILYKRLTATDLQD